MGADSLATRLMDERHVNIYVFLRRFLRLLRLNRLARGTMRFMPKRIRSWYTLAKSYSQDHTLVSPQELEPELRRAMSFLVQEQGVEALGDYLEFGVCHGTSLACMHRVLSELGYDHVRLFGFDSFEGLPETAEADDDGRWHAGQFNADYQWTRRKLAEEGVDWTRTHLVEGWFSETLNDDLIREHQIDKASVIMVDCDMYLSAKEALDFCAPLIQDQAIILFDDWHAGELAQKHMGEKRAFDEFLEENDQLTAQEFGAYSYRGVPSAKIFLVTNTGHLSGRSHRSKAYASRGS